MPQLNTTIDNVSPLIEYDSVWTEGSRSNDPLFDRSVRALMGGKNATEIHSPRYSHDTFTLCVVNGASASFSFNGTGVWIYGAKRGNHGPYKVVLDNVLTRHDGFSVDPGLFQFPLFSGPSLADGLHTVTITNEQTDRSQPFLDIDFVRFAL